MSFNTLLVLTSMVVAQPSEPGSPTEIIFTNKPSSELTIQYEGRFPRSTLSQIELVVSRDQGQTWKVVAAVTPAADNFVFNAPENGFYFLSMVFHTKDGRRIPADVSSHPPELKLLVDTTPPEVRLLQVERVGREVLLEWAIVDQFPKPAATEISYRPVTSPEGAWVPVPAGSISGSRARFQPTMTDAIEVRVSVTDYGTNTAEQVRKLPAGASDFPSITTAYAPDIVPVSSPPVQPNPVGAGMVLPVVAVDPLPAEPLPPPSLSSPTLPPTLPWGPETPSAPNNPPPPPTTDFPPPTQLPHPTPLPAPTDAPAFGSNLAPAPDFTAAPLTPPPAPSTAPSDPQIIRFTQFALNYNVDGSGRSGLSRIDLYITRDDGKTWTRWSQHPQTEQPLRVVLDSSFNRRNPQLEGDYGLRLVPVSGAGLSEPPPTAGTPPEFRVRVDVSPPQILGYAPEPDPNERNAMILRWQIKDANKNPGAPVGIEWSENPAGPWTSVASPGPGQPDRPIPDTERYTWVLPDGFPAVRVHLRFSAVDMAGNQSVVVSPKPFLIDPHKPRARILSIAPAASPALPAVGGYPSYPGTSSPTFVPVGAGPVMPPPR